GGPSPAAPALTPLDLDPKIPRSPHGPTRRRLLGQRGDEDGMVTYRHDKRREQLRRQEVTRYAALLETRQRFGERLYELSSAEPQRSLVVDVLGRMFQRLLIWR